MEVHPVPVGRLVSRVERLLLVLLLVVLSRSLVALASLEETAVPSLQRADWLVRPESVVPLL